MGEESKEGKKEVFTTGEAARFCRISQQSIIRSFDNGDLKGHRVPNSKFRRILKEDLIKYMEKNKMPAKWIKEVEEV